MSKGVIASIVVALVFIAGAWYAAVVKQTPATGSYQTVMPSEFAQLWNKEKDAGAVLLDVRTPAEYQQGHFEGAQNLDFYAPDFQARLAALPKDTTYFIYCRSGNRSGQVLQLMQQMGFQRVINLQGGIAGAGEILPIVTGDK